MENFIPALLIIGSVIYKIYSEYKKDQESARTRNPGRPVTRIPEIPQVKEAPTLSKPITVPRIDEKIRNKYVPETFQVEGPKRRQEVAPKTIAVEVLPASNQGFDLRNAIIQQAILERPYK